jgi:predicted transcriptional regulator
MTTLTVEIDKEKDLPVLQALLNRLELKYHIDNEDYNLTDAELEGINAGLEDIKAGRVHTVSEVKTRIAQKISRLRNNG